MVRPLAPKRSGPHWEALAPGLRWKVSALSRDPLLDAGMHLLVRYTTTQEGRVAAPHRRQVLELREGPKLAGRQQM